MIVFLQYVSMPGYIKVDEVLNIVKLICRWIKDQILLNKLY